MPVLHLLAGPNGSGKTTFVERVLQPTTHLPFVNADVIAAEHWPGDPSAHAYDASRLAAAERRAMMAARWSFITETVFSHPSKNELVRAARSADYLVHLHVMLVPVDVSVARVVERVRDGGHDVPEEKIRARHDRLWDLVVEAVADADRVVFYDNTSAATPFRRVALFERGEVVDEPAWPRWTPAALLVLSSSVDGRPGTPPSSSSPDGRSCRPEHSRE